MYLLVYARARKTFIIYIFVYQKIFNLELIKFVSMQEISFNKNYRIKIDF